jgi:hypothetical protein
VRQGRNGGRERRKKRIKGESGREKWREIWNKRKRGERECHVSCWENIRLSSPSIPGANTWHGGFPLFLKPLTLINRCRTPLY